MATLTDAGSKAAARESGWVNRLFAKETYTPEYQELKFTLHRKLLDRINLEALSSMASERVRAEIRAAVARLVEEEKTPLSLVEKDRVIEEILDEVFGLGPLEPLLQDPTISRHPGHHAATWSTSSAAASCTARRWSSRTTRTCCASSKRSCRAWAGAWTNRRRMVDARLPDGSRVNAAIPPVAVDGPLLSIRRFGRDHLKGEDLVEEAHHDRRHAAACCRPASRRASTS